MLAFLSNFGVAFNVALLVIWSSWARGGSSPHYYWALPWICLLVWEAMLLFPPRRFGESANSAFRRLFVKMVKDPIFYFGALLLVFLLIQWLNGPRVLEWNAVDSEWQFSAPPVPDLPSNADSDGARQVFVWFSSVVTAILAIRIGMRRRSCYIFLNILVANGALLAILGFLQLAFSPHKLFWYRPMSVFFFATFGYPNHAGTFFLLMSAVNMGLLIRALAMLDEVNHPIFLSITLLLNVLAVYFSLCRAAIVLVTLLILFGLVYGCIYLHSRIGWTGIAKILAGALVVFGCLAGVYFSSGSDFSHEVKTITAENLAGVYDGDRKQLADAALEIWKDNPWPGVGGWSFKQYVGLYIPKENWDMLRQSGKANVHNDLLQFLCEHGAIGGGLIFLLAITMLIHLCVNLSNMERIVSPSTGKDSSWLGSVPPTVVMSLAGLACVVVHSTIDLPFRSTANLIAWFSVLACLPGIVRRRD